MFLNTTNVLGSCECFYGEHFEAEMFQLRGIFLKLMVDVLVKRKFCCSKYIFTDVSSHHINCRTLVHLDVPIFGFKPAFEAMTNYLFALEKYALTMV